MIRGSMPRKLLHPVSMPVKAVPNIASQICKGQRYAHAIEATFQPMQGIVMHALLANIGPMSPVTSYAQTAREASTARYLQQILCNGANPVLSILPPRLPEASAASNACVTEGTHWESMAHHARHVLLERIKTRRDQCHAPSAQQTISVLIRVQLRTVCASNVLRI